MSLIISVIVFIIVLGLLFASVVEASGHDTPIREKFKNVIRNLVIVFALIVMWIRL